MKENQQRIYEDTDGREVVFTQGEDTYVLMAGNVHKTLVFQKGFAPKVGVNGFFAEQLFHVLIHRYRELDAAIPHLANKQTIELLEQAMAIQAARYNKRAEEGKLGTMQS